MAIIHFFVVMLMGSIKTSKDHQYQCLLVGESSVSTTNTIVINIDILHDQGIVFHRPVTEYPMSGTTFPFNFPLNHYL